MACNVTSKAFITITSLIFWLAAGGLIFLGAWVFKEYRNYELMTQSYYTLVPASILIAVGVFFFLLGIVGCVGACKEQKCLLGMFFSIMLIILCGMTVSAVLGYIYHSDVEKGVTDGITEGMEKYYNPNETAWKEQIDFMQTELKCCGLQNYTNWFKDYQKPYPTSCCIEPDSNTTCPVNRTVPLPANTTTYQVNTDGCYHVMKDQFKTHLGVIVGVSFAFAIILILGIIFSCVLICKRRSEVPYIGLREPSGMRV